MGKLTTQLTLVTQPQEFFHELVTQAMSRQKLKTQPETEFYLVNLLHQFMSTENLFTHDAEGHVKDEPLALMMKDALEQPEPNQQKLLFRQIGDISLYTAGFFHYSLNRKRVDPDYYISMGGVAYQNVAARALDMQKVFKELASRFSAFVDVLAEVSDATTPKNNEQDLLRLYDLWVKTKSDRAAKALKEAGIIPNSTIKKDEQ